MVGSVLAAALGDAMAHPLEATVRSDADRGRDAPRLPPSTDVTRLTEAVLAALVEGQADDMDVVMRALGRRLVEWSKAPLDPHSAHAQACLAACRRLDAGVPWHQAGGPSHDDGSVLRAHPFGLALADDTFMAEAWAVEHSRVTHSHPIALAACAAMAVGTALAVHGRSPDDVARSMREAAARHDQATAALIARAWEDARGGVRPEHALPSYTGDSADGAGDSAAGAVAAALYIFTRHPDDPRAAILEGAHTPGATAALASMAGALTGARAGLGQLPVEWIRDLDRADALQALARQLVQFSAGSFRN